LHGKLLVYVLGPRPQRVLTNKRGFIGRHYDDIIWCAPTSRCLSLFLSNLGTVTFHFILIIAFVANM
jgi:hypothetical protein